MKINDEKFWKDKNVFLTGGSGFIGGHLTDALTKYGANVQHFYHKHVLQQNHVVGDLADRKAVHDLRVKFAEFNPDIVIHLAAQPLVNREKELLFETLDINIRGTYNLLAACVGVRSIQSIVHISTDKVYGNLDVITEEAIPNGVEHPYNASKLSGDIIAQMFANTFGLPIVIIRNGNIYGAKDHHWDRIVPRTARNLLMGMSPVIRGDGKMLRDYIHVSEIVLGIMNSAEYGWARTTPTILRLGSIVPYSVADVVHALQQQTGKIDVEVKYEEPLRGEIPNQHIIDTTSQRLIGWYPSIDLESGLALTVPYYKHYVERQTS